MLIPPELLEPVLVFPECRGSASLLALEVAASRRNFLRDKDPDDGWRDELRAGGREFTKS